MKRVFSTCGLGVLLAVGANAQVNLMELPEPTRGIRLGEVHFSPFADLMYFYDSNVDFVNDNATGDSGWQLKVGGDLSYGSNEHTLFGRGWYMIERFMDQDRVDRNQWLAEMGYSFESPNGTALRLDEIYEQVFQNDMDTGRWQDRREFRVNANLGRQFTEKTSAVLGAGVSDITYVQNGLYDWREYTADLDLGQRLSAKSDFIVNLAVTEQTSESVKDNSRGYSLSAGISSRPTSKVTYRATAGLESYTSGVDNDSTLGATYKLAMDWRVSAKWTASVSGTGQYQPGEDVARNYAQVFTLGTGLTYKPTRRINATMQALYRRDEFAEPVRKPGGPTIYVPVNGPSQTWLIPVQLGGGRWRAEDRIDDQITLRGDISFKLTKYATLSAGGEYGVRTSTIEGQYGYDRYRLQTGLNLRY
jgi:hypothetical protein